MAWYGNKNERAAYNRGYSDALAGLPENPPTVKTYSFDGCAWCGGKVEGFHRAPRGHIRWYKYCSIECDKTAQHFRVFFVSRGGNRHEWKEALASKEIREEFTNFRNAREMLKKARSLVGERSAK